LPLELQVPTVASPGASGIRPQAVSEQSTRRINRQKSAELKKGIPGSNKTAPRDFERRFFKERMLI
jgi:hypothetical protein